MTPQDRTQLAARLFVMNATMRDLQEYISEAAAIAKESNATALAFATFHLSESLAVYIAEVNRFATGALEESE
ncbi:MAG: hypothetical protein EBR82_68035 [Caulobacteraceae bacterium]|nr:hypothetical protein [Caulobacteraceae bacterium]NBW19672.1 hypothetical protein [Caulobacteraceae bacterium]